MGLGTVLQALALTVGVGCLLFDVAGAATASTCTVRSSTKDMDMDRVFSPTRCMVEAECDGKPVRGAMSPIGMNKRYRRCQKVGETNVLYSPLYPDIYRLGPLRNQSLFKGYPSLWILILTLISLPFLGRFNTKEPISPLPDDFKR